MNRGTPRSPYQQTFGTPRLRGAFNNSGCYGTYSQQHTPSPPASSPKFASTPQSSYVYQGKSPRNQSYNSPQGYSSPSYRDSHQRQSFGSDRSRGLRKHFQNRRGSGGFRDFNGSGSSFGNTPNGSKKAYIVPQVLDNPWAALEAKLQIDSELGPLNNSAVGMSDAVDSLCVAPPTPESNVLVNDSRYTSSPNSDRDSSINTSGYYEDDEDFV